MQSDAVVGNSKHLRAQRDRSSTIISFFEIIIRFCVEMKWLPTFVDGHFKETFEGNKHIQEIRAKEQVLNNSEIVFFI